MLRVRLRNSELDELGKRFSELATKAAGVKIGKPDSPTGKLFIENMRTSNNMEQLREQIDDAKRAEEDVLRSMAEQRDAERKMDVQGNPLNTDGSLKVDVVNSINDITDDDFETPERNVQLPAIPKNVDDAIGANGKPVVIKKSIFNKNKNSHRDLTPEDGRRILQETFFNTNLYGQNKKSTRPYNWILIHLADKNSSVIVEVNENKDNVEGVNWHYLGNEELERKKRQAVKEGGLILTLSDDNVAANARDRLSSTVKDIEDFSEKQESGAENKPSLQELRSKYPDRVLGEQRKDGSISFHDKDALAVSKLLHRDFHGTELTLPLEEADKALQKLMANGFKAAIYGEEYNPKAAVKKASEIEGVRFRREDSYDGSVKDVNHRFNEELEQQIKGELPKGHVYQLGKPSSALRSAGIPDLPIELVSSRLSDKSMQENHPFDLKEVKNLPEAIQNPIAVFRSATHIGSFVVMTEIEHKGKNFVAAIQANKKKGKIEINDIRSIHYRTSNNHMANWIDEGLLEFVDKKRMSEWLSKQRYNSAEVKQLYGRATKIVENFENPTLEDGEIVSSVESLADELNTPVRIVRNVDEIKDEDSNMQRKKRGSKGWYGPKTGEVVVVLPNAKDVGDAQATVLHEVVGHKGIRGLFGDKIGEFTKRVLDSMPEAERKKLVEKYGGNEQLAAEEYVAQFAEGYENPGMWEKIVAIVRELLRDLGIDLKLSDADLKYTLWRGVQGMQEGRIGYEVKDRAIRRSLFREVGDDARIGRSLNSSEAEEVLKQMQENAEVAPELELTPDNWVREFGEDGMIDTPLGKVKMGDGQYLKMAQQGRNGKLGMVKPTLTNPDVVIEDVSEAKDGNTERASSYVFVKSFVNESGERNYLFTSVTIRRDGNEVVVSNQEKSANRISTLLQQGTVAWIKSDSLHPKTQVKESVPFNDSNSSTNSDNQTARLGINSSVDSSDKSKKVISEKQDLDAIMSGLTEELRGRIEAEEREIADLELEERRYNKVRDN